MSGRSRCLARPTGSADETLYTTTAVKLTQGGQRTRHLCSGIDGVPARGAFWGPISAGKLASVSRQCRRGVFSSWSSVRLRKVRFQVVHARKGWYT